jgi:hypothetical protein
MGRLATIVHHQSLKAADGTDVVQSVLGISDSKWYGATTAAPFQRFNASTFLYSYRNESIGSRFAALYAG